MNEVDVYNETQRMSLKWILQVLVQYEIILITSPSITGVTYRDHFDFEERYTDANECNPFYWHPLHLPPKCAEIFEKAIRTRLAGKTGKRLTMKRQKKKYQYQQYYDSYSYSEEMYPFYEMTSAEYHYQLSPQEELINILRKDIEKDPSSPVVTVMPNLGPVALYKQAISKKSENKLIAMAKAYAKASKKTFEKYYPAYRGKPLESNLFVYDGSDNKTVGDTTPKNESKNEKKNKVHRVRTKHGNVVTIIETKNLEAMQNEGFLS